MLKDLHPVPVEVAASPGFAVGLAAARRGHLSVSLGSAHSSRGLGSGASPYIREVRAHDLPSGEHLLHVGDVLIALNGVPTVDYTRETLVQKMLRLCHHNGTWVTVARPVGPLVLKQQAGRRGQSQSG